MNCAHANANGQFKLMTLLLHTHTHPHTHRYTQNAQKRRACAGTHERRNRRKQINLTAALKSMQCQIVQHQMSQCWQKCCILLAANGNSFSNALAATKSVLWFQLEKVQLKAVNKK